MTINLSSVSSTVQSIGNFLLKEIVPKESSHSVVSKNCSSPKIEGSSSDKIASEYLEMTKGIMTGLSEIIAKLLGVLSTLLPTNFDVSNANTNDTTFSNNSSNLSGMSTPASGLSDQFLWKPVSEKDGKLVVLFPARLTGSIKGATIVSSEGKVLAQGRDVGFGNGGRHHFRFDRAGADYPAGARLVGQLQDGSKYEVEIKTPHKRTIK
jgi:hypothetical protein